MVARRSTSPGRRRRRGNRSRACGRSRLPSNCSNTRRTSMRTNPPSGDTLLAYTFRYIDDVIAEGELLRAEAVRRELPEDVARLDAALRIAHEQKQLLLD